MIMGWLSEYSALRSVLGDRGSEIYPGTSVSPAKVPITRFGGILVTIFAHGCSVRQDENRRLLSERYKHDIMSSAVISV